MYKVTVTTQEETTTWSYNTIELAAEFIANLHANYKSFTDLVQGRDYEVELAEVK